MEFEPLEKNGIDKSEKRFKEAPDCDVKECPANSFQRCIKVGECLIMRMEIENG